MKKYKYSIYTTLVVIMLQACFKDNGNYNYDSPEVISISGISDSYVKISMIDSLNIYPEVSSTDPEADMDYFWGIYETNVQGSIPKLDTIARSKNLNYLIHQTAKTWVLVFSAKNKNTGFSQHVSSKINVGTEFTRGWYVLKDENEKSDLDFYRTPHSIVPEPSEPYADVFFKANGKKLNGKALGINFDTQYKSTVTGINSNTRAFFTFTEKDASVIYSNSMYEIKNFDSLFLEVPSVKAPQAMFLGSSAEYIINDGGIHDIYTMATNYGVFGARQMRDAYNTSYRLSKYYLTQYGTTPILFDEESTSFVAVSPGAATLTNIKDAKTTTMPSKNTNKNLLYMGISNASSKSLQGIAILQDKTDGNLKILSVITPNIQSFKLINDTLQTSSMLYSATAYGPNIEDESMLYFATEKQIWSYNLVNKYEQLQYTLPADETLTFIKHRKYIMASDVDFNFNFVMIGSTDGTNYTIRMFTKTAGNLSSAPTITMKGRGITRDVIYLAPSIGNYTFPNSY